MPPVTPEELPFACTQCGYDLRGIADGSLCPECGALVNRPPPFDPLAEPQSDPLVVRDAILLCALLGACSVAATGGGFAGVVASWSTFALWVASSWREFSRTSNGRFGWVALPMIATGIAGQSLLGKDGVGKSVVGWWAILLFVGAGGVVACALRERWNHARG
jgi:hypothetical protein